VTEAAPEGNGSQHSRPQVAAEDNAHRFSPPSVAIVIELECWPKLVWNALNDGEQRRLYDWISSNDKLAELVGRAVLASPAFWERLDEIADA
jgi:hypothetical protein